MKTLARQSLAGWLGSCIVLASYAAAQGGSATDILYSHGVHAYFRGDFAQADYVLSQAIEGDSNDPRCFYFRAMCRLRMGRNYEARKDMQAGAAIEALAPNRFAVGEALQRVQGPDRLLLEQYRRRARLDEATQRNIRLRDRYEHVMGREQDVLRRTVTVPLEDLLEPGGMQSLVKPAPAPRSPPAAAQPPAPADGPRLGNPFVDDPTNAQPKPRADKSAAPLPPQTNDAGVPEANPFGDAFSGPAPEPDSSAPPQQEPTESDVDDPFGGF